MRRIVSLFACLTWVSSCRRIISSLQLQRSSHGLDRQPQILALKYLWPRVIWLDRQACFKGLLTQLHALSVLLLVLNPATAFNLSGQQRLILRSSTALGGSHTAVLVGRTNRRWGATCACKFKQLARMASAGTRTLSSSIRSDCFHASAQGFSRCGSQKMATKVGTKRIGKQRVEVGELLRRGSFGKVHLARLLSDGRDGTQLDVVAKCADALNPNQSEEAEAFFESEAAINANVAGCPGICGYLGEAVSDDGRRYLLFDRIRPLNGADGPPDSLLDLLGTDRLPMPLAPGEMLRQVLNALAYLHRAGYVHQDVKLDNLLLQSPSPAAKPKVGQVSIKLIDLGSAVSVESCDFFGRMLQNCDLDKVQSCSRLYAPPEKAIDPEHPYAFDIFSAAICFLQLAWVGTFDTQETFTGFRDQLAASDGDLERWLRTQLQATVVPEALLEGLARFPGEDMSAFAMVRAMLNPDPAKRPSADALLAHPFLLPNPKVLANSDQTVNYESSLRALLETEECRLPGFDVEERRLAIRVQLSKPLGLAFDEVPLAEGGGVVIKDILPIGSGAANGKLDVGDRLVSVGETSLRDATYKQAMATIKSSGGFFGFSPIEFLFERTCSDPEFCELPASQITNINGVDIGVTTDSSNALFEAPLVRDSGSFATIGGRSKMEDTYIVTSFTVTTATGPRSFVLAAVFDGHRGGAASAHAAATLPRAVSAAIAEGEPSPLAVAWRRTVDSYLQSGKQAGSTATAVLLGDNGIAELLNCGDSRTVVGSASASVLYATKDHDPGSAEELQRIRGSGGFVDCSVGGKFRVRVDAPSVGSRFSIAVARALGGSEWVAGRISNAADVTILRLPADPTTIVLASDGLWPALRGASGSAEAIERVSAARRKGLSAGDAAQQLVAVARERGSKDNCAVVVLYIA